MKRHPKAPPAGAVPSSFPSGFGSANAFGRGQARPLPALLVLIAAVAAFACAPNVASAAPEERAYELVSPPEIKRDAAPSVSRPGFASFTAASGEGVVFISEGATADAEANAVNFYRSIRSPSGWATEAILPKQGPQMSIDLAGYQWFDESLSTGVLMNGDPPLVSGAPEEFNNLYRVHFDGGLPELLTPLAPLNTPATQAYVLNGYIFVGQSTDEKHTFFESSDALTPEAPPYVNSLYEFSEGELYLVGVRPDGTPDPGGSFGGGGAGTFWYASSANSLANAVSDDGSTVFWTSGSDGQIYVRINGSTTGAVSESQASTPDPNGPQRASYACAAADGSSALFTSSSELTNDANTGEDGSGNSTDAGTDLYRYRTASGELEDLSVDTEAADSEKGADVRGVVGCSEDAEFVYFVATGKLAPGAVSGSPNLYLSHEGTVSFIATLVPADQRDWASTQEESGFFYQVPYWQTASVASDGSRVAFTSQAPLTGYDNTDSEGTPRKEVYVYDVSTDALNCASCRPDGRPVGDSVLPSPESPFNLRRPLAEEGRRVFFQSTDVLVPGDTNNRPDVYEYEEGGVPRLISDGRGSGGSMFLGTGASGNDVFFTTRNRLVGWDTNGNVDVYDARVGGGFPEPTPTPPACRDDECQGTPGEAPAQLKLGSAAFHGTPAHPRAGGPITSVHRLNDAQLSRLAKGRAVILRMRTNRRGRVTVLGRGRKGGLRGRLLLKGSGDAVAGGTARIRIGLTERALRQLKQGGAISMLLRFRFNGSVVSAGHSGRPKSMTLTVQAPKHAARRQSTGKAR